MDAGWSLFYSTWMDKAEQHQHAAKVMNEAQDYDPAIVLYRKAIDAFQRASKFTSSEEDKQDINNTCQDIKNRIKLILSQNQKLQSKYNCDSSSESDTDDDDDGDKEQKAPHDSPITIQILSDIHLEFDGTYEKMPKLNNKADVLALLGDIGYPKMDVYKQFITEMSTKYKYVLIIAGNHEYYKDEMYNVHAILTEIDHNHQNVFFLHKRSVEFPDLSSNIRFIGTTLWTHYPKKIQYKASFAVNDFHLIQINKMALEHDLQNTENNPVQPMQEEQKDTEPKHNVEDMVLAELMGDVEEDTEPILKHKTNRKCRMSVNDVESLHQDQLKWIKKEIAKAKKEKKQLMILTHHAPTSYKCISPTDEIDDVSFAMCFSSLEKLFKYPVICWAFGHTHYNCDFIVMSEKGKKRKQWCTRVVSNQLGYYDQRKLSFEAKDCSMDKVIVLSHKTEQNDGLVYIDRQTLKEKVKSAKERIRKLT